VVVGDEGGAGVEGLGRRGQRLVQLDRVDLLGHRHDGSNRVLNFVGTESTRIPSYPSLHEIRCGTGFSGGKKDMYLLSEFYGAN
jgi:hypothetical protein